MTKSTVIEATVLLVLVGVSIWIASHPTFVAASTDVMESAGAYSYGVFVGLLVAAVVLAPVVVMPLIPLATQLFGPFAAALLSIVGWTIGSMIAFLIARYIGRPVLERYVSLQSIDRFASTVPLQSHFWFIFCVRHVLPVDVVSYALGLVPTVSFVTFSIASFFGVMWFSFAFAYLGEAFFSGQTYILIEIALASLFVFGAAWYIVRIKQQQSSVTK